MTEFGTRLLSGPLSLIFLCLIGALVISAYVGHVLRKKFARPQDLEEGKDQEGYIFSAVMGLLALLVGFTFSLAIDRYDNRRMQVLHEANSIGTTYLRTQLLEEPHRTRISNLIVQYTDNRVALGKLKIGPEQDKLVARNDQLLTDLWAATVEAFPTVEARPFSTSYLQTMNEMIDMDAERKAARRAHVPPQVFALLMIYEIITAGVIGYIMTGRNGRKISALLLFLFALSVILIIDLDSPTSGTVRERQTSMLELQKSLHDNPPGSYDRMFVPPPPS